MSLRRESVSRWLEVHLFQLTPYHCWCSTVFVVAWYDINAVHFRFSHLRCLKVGFNRIEHSYIMQCIKLQKKDTWVFCSMLMVSILWQPTFWWSLKKSSEKCASERVGRLNSWLKVKIRITLFDHITKMLRRRKITDGSYA